MKGAFNELFDCCRDAFRQSRTAERARALGYGLLSCLGRHTVTGMLSATGRQFLDWTSAYRLFGKGRIAMEKLFSVCSKTVLRELLATQMLVAHMDDTIVKKTGKKVPGTAWRKDPLGPAFQNNLIWGQRFVQISLALSDSGSNCQSRAIPVDFHHCPTIKKPGKTAGEAELKKFREEQRLARLSRQGSLRIQALRQRLDGQGAADRPLYISVDGSYTNETVLKTLPERVVLTGRIRKDAKLYQPAEQRQANGRRKVYGERLPTPEEIRQSDLWEWQKVTAWAAGKSHEFQVKVVRDVLWRTAGQNRLLQLVVIRPLGYRLTKNSPLLYRQPAYLICTDSGLEIDKLLQAYLWRWEIEVNFRDEKTLLGCGQAQVRTPKSVENLPAFTVAMYAFLHLAAYRSNKSRDHQVLPKAKWDTPKPTQRLSSSEILNLFRGQLWSNSFSGFINNQHLLRSRRMPAESFQSALFYMRK